MRLAALVLLLLALARPTSAGGEVTHVLRDGETLDAVARYFYGAGWKSVYIVSRNGLSAETDAKVGKSYVVPSSWMYKVHKGDSYPAIAKHFLGDAARDKSIMAVNGVSDVKSIEPGNELLMPFVLKHTVANGESLAGITKLYFHSTKQVKLLQEYNNLPSATVTVGAKLSIPVFDKDTVDVKTKSPMPKGQIAQDNAIADNSGDQPEGRARTTLEPPLAMPSDDPSDTSAAARIRRSVKQYKNGDFDEACRELERLLNEPRLGREDKARIFEYCGYCAVAFNNRGAARDLFAKWLQLHPEVQLDPITTSPKIREAVDEARRDLQRATADAAAAAAAANAQANSGD